LDIGAWTIAGRSSSLEYETEGFSLVSDTLG